MRIDCGVRAGDAISPFYDPMIAKLIVWGRDREEALAQMAQCAVDYQMVGLTTNIAFLKRLVESTPFAGADLDTGLIERNQEALFPPPQPAFPGCAGARERGAAGRGTATCCRQQGPMGGHVGWRMNSAAAPARFMPMKQPLPVTIAYRRRAGRGGRPGPAAMRTWCGTRAATIVSGSTAKAGARHRGDRWRDVHVFAAERHALLRYIDPLLHAGEAEDEGAA